MGLPQPRRQVCVMRRARSYLPTGVFHLTARTSGREHWFDEDIRTQIVTIIASAQHRTDTQIHAWVVMSNHFHLIVRQGSDPLWRLMQPICRRIALRVQRKLDRCGHIFERRFRDHECADADHLRNAIVYVHGNPVTAGLSSSPGSYPWSSQHLYGHSSVHQASSNEPHITSALELFAREHASSISQQRDDYQKYAEWWEACRRLGPDVPHPPPPAALGGDRIWRSSFRNTAVPVPPRSSRPDLRDLVVRVTHEVAPGLTQEDLRNRRGGRVVAAIRSIAITRARRHGYRGAELARYFNISDAAVSKIATKSSLRLREETGRSGPGFQKESQVKE